VGGDGNSRITSAWGLYRSLDVDRCRANRSLDDLGGGGKGPVEEGMSLDGGVYTNLGR